MIPTLNISATEQATLLCKKGDQFALSLQISNEDGSPYDLSVVADAAMAIKLRPSYGDPLVLFTMGGDLSTGMIQIDASTSCVLISKGELNLPPVAYSYDIQLVDINGNKLTILEGVLRMLADVTP